MSTRQWNKRAGRTGPLTNVGILALAAILALPATVAAQQNDDVTRGSRNPAQGEFFLYGQAAVSVGGPHRYEGLGGGLAAGGTLFLNRARTAALRVEGNLNAFDGEFDHPPHSATMPGDMLVRTDNTIFSAGIGPQIYLRGGAVRPYVFGTLGVAYLAGDMGVSGQLGQEPFDVTADLSDFGVSLGAGGGFSVQVRGGDYPVAVDVSGSYQHYGVSGHMEQEETVEGTGHEAAAHRAAGGRDNHVTFPHGLSDFNLVAWRIGVSLGLS